MESKIRILIGKLEDNENIKIAHVNPTSYPRNVTDRYGWILLSLSLPLSYLCFLLLAYLILTVSLSLSPPSLFMSPFSTDSHLMWFIGLEFCVGPGGVNITLTYEIQMFINSGTTYCTCCRFLLCSITHVVCVYIVLCYASVK